MSYRIEKTDTDKLAEPQKKLVLKFLQERYYSYLAKKLFIMLAWHKKELAAVVFYEINPIEILEVPIFYLAEKHQNEELATLLLTEIENTGSKCKGAVLVYEESPFESVFDDLLEKHQWDEPENFKLRCLFHSPTFNAPWLNYPYKLPKGYEIFPWKELTEKERLFLLEQEKQEVFPHAVSPFKKEELLEPLNSFGLRFNSQIIGWLITHRINPDLISYVSFWTAPGHRAFGPNIQMLAKAIRIHIDNKILWGETEANYIQVNHRWIRFFEKKLIPYSKKVTRLYRAFKSNSASSN